jgi:hypothetical protein
LRYAKITATVYIGLVPMSPNTMPRAFSDLFSAKDFLTLSMRKLFNFKN